MNPLLVRFSICAAICLPLAILAAVSVTHEKKKIEVRTSGATADVIAAIEALDRSDLEVQLSPANSTGPIPVTIVGTLGMALGLWIAVTVVVSLERFLLARRK